MKKILLFGAIALTTLSFGQNVPNYVPTNGLVGWWPFNGNANDESGNGNHGTVNGSTLTSDRNSLSSKAYNFDYNGKTWANANKLIYFPYSSSYNSNYLTVSAWIYPRSYFWQGNNGDPNSTIIRRFENGYSNPNGQTWGIDFNSTSVKGWILEGATNNSQNSAVVTLNTPFNLNQWYHVAMTYDGNTLILYINGVVVATKTTNLSINTFSNSGISVGVSKQANGYWYDADAIIDDIGLWNTALSEQEITSLFNTSTCQLPTATITPQSNTTFCQGGFVNLNASTGTNYSYEWYKNGQIINGATASVYQASTSGNYTVKVIDGACNTTSTASTVTVKTNPTVSFTLPNLIHNENGNFTLNATPTGGLYSGNGVSGNVFDPANSGLGTVDITYDYTDNNGCSNSKTVSTIVYDTTGTVCTSYVSVAVTDTLIIDVSLAGLSAPNNINTMKVYPNPSNDIVNIDNGNYALMNGYSIKIINANAQEVFNAQINSQLLQVAVSQLGATGNYFINVYDNNQLLIESKVLVLQ